MGELIALGLVRVMRPEPHRTNIYLLADGTPAVLAALKVLDPEEPKGDPRLQLDPDWYAYA